MSTGDPDQPQRGHLTDFYQFIDQYEFIDAGTNWLLLFNREPREPGELPAFESPDAGRDWLVGFDAHDDVPQPSSKKWAGGRALVGVGLAVLVAGIVFAPRPTTPPTAHAPGSLESQQGVSVATGARPDVTTPALAPLVPAPTAAMVVQTLASRSPDPVVVARRLETVPAPESALPARVPAPASTAPDIGASAARVAATPAAPVATAASTDVPTIVVPAVQALPVPGPSPAVALAAVAPETPAPATPAPTPAVPATAVATPPAAAAGAATATIAPATAVAAVVPVREAETRAIQTVLGRYRDAFNTLDARGAFAVWPGVNEKDLARAFERLEEQHLSFDQCRIEVGGAMAEAACTGTARFVPRVGNRISKAEAREWRFMFRKVASGWVIDRVQAR